MNPTSLDIEQSFIYIMATLALVGVVISMFFTLENNFNLALYYMMGALMSTQFLMIYQETKSKRKIQAAIQLLEKKIEEDKGENE